MKNTSRKNLLLGDHILIERAGDVIPQIVKSFPELRKGDEKYIQFPVTCPVCNHPLFKTADESLSGAVQILAARHR
jgi:DNA ligase (NAD+)